MANYQQAPTLHHNGAKENGSNNFYKIPQELADIVFKELGNASAQLRIMMVLIGTKPDSFNISDAWICERTGLLHPSYITARKALVKRGWITHEPAKGITVNFDAIYGRNSSNTTLPEEENKNKCSNTTLPQKSNMVLPQRSNMVLPQSSNMVLPIINNIDNKIDKEIDNSEMNQPTVDIISLTEGQEEESQKPIVMTAQEAIKKFGTSAVLNRISSGVPNCFWINGTLVKVI